jgi:hypothetical protein
MELVFLVVVVVGFFKLVSMAPKSRLEREIDERNHNNIEARKELFARMHKETGATCYQLDSKGN